MGIPTVIHESNAYPGKATKFLNKKLTKILLGFKDAEKFFDDKSKLVVTGNPTKVKEEKNIRRRKKKNIARIRFNYNPSYNISIWRKSRS